ncbi:MAG: rod shape-determining protein RodA [Actinobacteria bacterium]|nr:rod shape-determining protein RodA [Actinomycetota bacterium]
MATVARTRPASVVLSDRKARLLATPFRHVDVLLVGSTIAVAMLSLLMIYSSTQPRLAAQHIDQLYYVKRQAVSILIGIALMFGVMAVDYRKLRDLGALFYVATVLGLLAVLSPLGHATKGAQARFPLPGGFELQPSEFAKFALIVALAAYLQQHRGSMDAWRVAVAVTLGLVPIGLVLLQPDLGTDLVLVVILLGLLTLAGVKIRHLLVLLLLAATACGAVVQLGVLKRYQIDRLTSFLNQGQNVKGSTYNVHQSKIAISNGHLTGKGFHRGTQTRLGFVPEQHTDFIFTVVGEELGFAGGATLLALFALIVWRTWRTAALAGDFFGTLLCIGVTALLTFQVFENVGMTMGIMPVTGIPLPFMSYGGSAVMAYFACIGLVAGVHMRRFT